MHHRHDKWRDFAEFDSCFLSEEVHQAFCQESQNFRSPIFTTGTNKLRHTIELVVIRSSIVTIVANLFQMSQLCFLYKAAFPLVGTLPCISTQVRHAFIMRNCLSFDGSKSVQ